MRDSIRDSSQARTCVHVSSSCILATKVQQTVPRFLVFNAAEVVLISFPSLPSLILPLHAGTIMRSLLVAFFICLVSNAYMDNANAQSLCAAGTVCAPTSSNSCGDNKLYCCAPTAEQCPPVPSRQCTVSVHCTMSSNTIVTATCVGFNYTTTAYSDSLCKNALTSNTADDDSDYSYKPSSGDSSSEGEGEGDGDGDGDENGDEDEEGEGEGDGDGDEGGEDEV